MKLVLAAALLALSATLPARALDCASATTPVERSLCGNSALRAADDAMSAAFADARASMPDDQSRALLRSQRRWLQEREDQCAYETPDKLAGCVAAATVDRTRFLEGGTLSGPGPASPLQPFLVQQDPSPTAYDIDYALLLFATPANAGERFFNAQVDAIAQRAPIGADIEPGGPEGVPLLASEAMQVAFASPTFISAAVSGYSYEGGAHGLGGEYGLNVDLAAGKLLDIGALFGSDAQAALLGDCRDMIAQEKKARFDDQTHSLDTDTLYSDEAVAQAISDTESWIFDATGARVVFNPYEIGAYAEGMYECRFAADRLRELAGAPLPID